MVLGSILTLVTTIQLSIGRASLAADLMEEFRSPIADRHTLNLINNRIFKEEDFYSNPKDNAVYLKRSSLKRYFIEYEKLLNNEFLHPKTNEKTTFRKVSIQSPPQKKI